MNPELRDRIVSGTRDPDGVVEAIDRLERAEALEREHENLRYAALEFYADVTRNHPGIRFWRTAEALRKVLYP